MPIVADVVPENNDPFMPAMCKVTREECILRTHSLATASNGKLVPKGTGSVSTSENSERYALVHFLLYTCCSDNARLVQPRRDAGIEMVNASSRGLIYLECKSRIALEAMVEGRRRKSLSDGPLVKYRTTSLGVS